VASLSLLLAMRSRFGRAGLASASAYCLASCFSLKRAVDRLPIETVFWELAPLIGVESRVETASHNFLRILRSLLAGEHRAMATQPENTPEERRSRYLDKVEEAHANADKATDFSVRQTWLNVERTWQFLADQVKRTSNLLHK